MSKPKNNFKKIALTVLFVIVLNFAGHFVFHRFDLTADKRYTLSETFLNYRDWETDRKSTRLNSSHRL